jgi:hypothetical protein
MVKSLRNIKEQVNSKVKKKTTKNLKRFVKKRNLKIWGENKDRLFFDKTFWISLYKLVFNPGYQKLLSEVNFYSVTTDSINHNVKEMTRHFTQWAETMIHRGDVNEWKKKVRNRSFNKRVADVNLWVDSSDFSRKGKKSTSKKSRMWSYKNNCPALRFSLLKDGAGEIRYISEGYSPKTPDHEFMKHKKEYLAKKWKGAVIAGDCAYYYIKDKVPNVKFHAPIPKTYKNEESERAEVKGRLTKEQQKYNDSVRELRGSVEGPFGWIKETFQILNDKSPFQQDCTFQENVVHFGVGVWNFQKK